MATKHLAVVLAVSVLMTACGGSSDRKDSSSGPNAVVSSPASSAVASSAASVVASSAASVVASSAASSAVVVASSAPSSVASSVASSEASSEASSVASSVSTAAMDLFYDFEADAVGTANPVSGYGGDAPASAIATVVDGTGFVAIPAQEDSAHVLKVISKNYHSGAKFTMVLPEGKTLADYDISFDLYMPTKVDADFTEGDNAYKTISVVAGSSITNFMNTETSLGADLYGSPSTYDLIGTADVGYGPADTYPADQWVTVTITTGANASSVSGTFELGVGVPRKGATVDTDFYLMDNIILNPKP